MGLAAYLAHLTHYRERGFLLQAAFIGRQGRAVGVDYGLAATLQVCSICSCCCYIGFFFQDGLAGDHELVPS